VRERIVCYTSGLSPCGVASYQRNLAQALAEFAEVTTIRLPTTRTFGADLPAMRARRAEMVALAQQSGEFTASIVDYTDTFFNGSRLGENLYPLFAKHLRCPAIVSLHENFGRTDNADVEGGTLKKITQRITHKWWAYQDTGTQDYVGFLKAKLFAHAAHIITHAPTLLDARPAERMHLLPTPAYPLPLSSWSRDEVDARFGTAGKRVMVLLGFPQLSKGFDRAIAALPHLPEDVVLVQIGDAPRCAGYAQELQTQAENLGVAGRWIRTGPLSDAEMHGVLLRADVALAPFRQVHQSSSLGHLIAVGLPILASNIRPFQTLVADGAGLQLMDTDQAKPLAEATLKLLAGSDELRAKNRTYTEQHSFRTTALKILELFRNPRAT
jgi:glycosyltransferase involved in cell wall biosynthesis